MPEKAIPFVSDNIADLITNKLLQKHYDFLIEYGAGDSTLFFLERLIPSGKCLSHIAVEGAYIWFDKLVRRIRDEFQKDFSSEEIRAVESWNYRKCLKFYRAASEANDHIPQHLARLKKYRKTFGGPLGLKMLVYRFFPAYRPVNGHFSATLKGRIDFKILLRTTLMKDQFGESPLKADYIDAPLEPIIEKLALKEDVRAVFIIDGGPRGDILDRILDLEETQDGFHPDIFLCDASRSVYRRSTGRRPAGRFVDGSNRTLSGEKLYTKEISGPKAGFVYGMDRVTPADLARNELWYYEHEQDSAGRIKNGNYPA